MAAGGLLEWLLAVRRAIDGAVEQPTRLGRLTCYRLGVNAAEALHCRTRSDGRLLVTAGARNAERLLLSATARVDHGRVAAAPSFTARDSLDENAFYAELAATTLEVDPGQRAVAIAEFGAGGAFATLHAPGEGESDFILGPRALDAALHVAFTYAERARGRGEGQRLCPGPVIEAFSVFVPAGVPRSVRVADSRTIPSGLDVWLEDEHGLVLAQLEGLMFWEEQALDQRLSEDLAGIFEAIIRECLPAASFDRHTSFSSLGASSLDLIRIGTLAQESLGWTPPLPDLLRTPTLAGLQHLYLRREARALAAPALTHALSATERQLWFLEHATNAAGSYNEGFAWRIQGALSVETLERALVAVQRRHPALRSYFPARAGTPERVFDSRPRPLEVIETQASVRSSPELLAELIDDQVCRPFDLEHAPPFRSVLVVHGDGEATLVLAAHHMICDAWSLTHVLASELQATYRALLKTLHVLPELASDSHEVEHCEPDAEYVRCAEAHFRELLADVPDVLDFPFDHPRPAVQTHRGASLHRPLTAARWGALKALACELGHSPFVVALAAHQILVQRYTRMDDFCLGVPVSLRRDADDARRLGCFVNLSVMRASVDSSASFDLHCARVKDALIETLRFDQLALGDIVRAVSPARSLSHTPLVQAVFAYRELTGTHFELLGATTTPVLIHNRRAKFDLTVSIDDYGEDAELSLEYASDLLERDSAVRLLDHFEALLDAILRDPRTQIAALQLPSARERARIERFESGPERAAPETLDLRVIWQRHEDAVLIRTRSRDWTTAALDARTQQIMSALQTAGVKPRDLVALCIPRSAVWVAAVLAILELGAGYVPLDPLQPAVRLRHGVACASARVVIALDRSFEPEPGADVTVIDLQQLAPNRKRAHAVLPSPDQPVYAILTSGSTGVPRVAAVAHAGFANLVASYRELLQLSAADRVLLATSIGFDLTQKNVFAALAAGAQLVIDEADEFDPDRVVELIDAHAITVLNCTPSLAYLLAAATELKKLRSLRVLVLGGEPIDWQPLRRWLEHPSCAVRILNSYGPTECSDVVTTAELTAADSGNDLGRPIPNARCRVVDHAGALAGIGVPGELLLGGIAVGLGYVDDVEATASKLITREGVRWYRTGDLVRWTSEGTLQYLGRIDTQVKIRGYRVELAEIDAALEREPSVAEAIVVSRPDPRGRQALVGYVVPARSQPIDADALRRAVARTLPSYMIPHAIVAIDRAPRTSSGKLDRNALAATPWIHGTDRLEPGRDSDDPVLDRVRAMFCQVLGLPAIASDAHFFEHGGHSLAAIDLVTGLEGALGVRLRVAAVFERPVLRDFAALVAEHVPNPSGGTDRSRGTLTSSRR